MSVVLSEVMFKCHPQHLRQNRKCVMKEVQGTRSHPPQSLTSTLSVYSEPSSRVTLHCMIFTFFTPLKGDLDRRLVDDLWDTRSSSCCSWEEENKCHLTVKSRNYSFEWINTGFPHVCDISCTGLLFGPLVNDITLCSWKSSQTRNEKYLLLTISLPNCLWPP